jgi:hypothetical protein
MVSYVRQAIAAIQHGDLYAEVGWDTIPGPSAC